MSRDETTFMILVVVNTELFPLFKSTHSQFGNERIVILNVLALGPGGAYITTMMHDYIGRTQQ